MHRKSSISLILPAYNEVKGSAQTIREAKAYFEQSQHPYEIIVSADGDDGTRELVAGMASSAVAVVRVTRSYTPSRPARPPMAHHMLAAHQGCP